MCYLFEYFGANFVVGKTTAVIANPAGGAPLRGYSAAAVDGAPIGTMTTRVSNILWSGSGKTISLIVAATVLVALIGTTLACLNTGVRVTFAMARDGEMPSILSLLHGKHATPHSGIWILTGVSAVIGIYGVHTVDNLTQITIASNVGTFLVYGATCLIAVVAFASRHDKHVGKHYVIPIIGALMNLAMLFAVLYLGLVGHGRGQAGLPQGPGRRRALDHRGHRVGPAQPQDAGLQAGRHQRAQAGRGRRRPGRGLTPERRLSRPLAFPRTLSVGSVRRPDRGASGLAYRSGWLGRVVVEAFLVTGDRGEGAPQPVQARPR